MKTVRYFLALSIFAVSWKYLDDWYIYQARSDYFAFALLLLPALLLAGGPALWKRLRSVTFSRIFLVSLLITIFLPWGEWLHIGFPWAREDWSRQILKQALFLCAIFLVFELFPQIPKLIASRTRDFLERFSSKKYFLWLPPLLFFCFTSWIAVFHFQRIPMVEDSAGHLFQAKIFSHLKLFAPAPPVFEFFSYQGDSLAMKNGHWFSVSLPGFSALLALAVPVRAEWFVSPLLAALTLGIWTAYIHKWHSRPLASLFGWCFLLSPFLFLMSSTIMVHTPELFIASAVILLCRCETESFSWRRATGLFFLVAAIFVVRPFSLLPFLAPVLAYTSLICCRRFAYKTPVAIVFGTIAGGTLLALFQWKTTGSPWTSTYLLEFPDYHFGFGPSLFGQVHTPARGLENISNLFLGVNNWLTGWYSGSFFFLLLHLLLKKDFQLWDRLFLLCMLCLIAFHFIFVAQDLIFGPRFFYLFAPLLLLMIVRCTVLESPSDTEGVRDAATALLVLCLLSFLPHRLPGFLENYRPIPYLRNQIEATRERKTLIFLDRKWQAFVNWNDPFLSGNVLLCRNLKSRNVEATSAFPEYHPAYFRAVVSFQHGQISGGYVLKGEPGNEPEGYLNLSLLALALKAGQDYPDKDCFDLCYNNLFTPEEGKLHQKFLRKRATLTIPGKKYKESFQTGVLEAGLLLLSPVVAFEERGTNWRIPFKPDEFRMHLKAGLMYFRESGEVGKEIVNQLDKVRRRIDCNADGELSDEEIRSYVSEKVKLLQKY